MNNKSKNIFLGFLFTLLILVSITAISATDTNSTSTHVEKQDVSTQTVEKITSTQEINKNTQENDKTVEKTTKENKEETTTTQNTKKQNTTNNIEKTNNKSLKQAYALGGWGTNKNNQTQKTVKTTTSKSLKQDDLAGNFQDLQKVIDDTTESNTLNLERSYTRASGESVVKINKTITINGQGYTIDANKESGIFNITGTNVILSNMTIKNSNGQSAITIENGASVTEDNITATNNIAKINGGVNNNNGNLTINNGTFTSNTASEGGVNYNTGNLTINNGTFSSNYAEYGGVNSNHKTGNLTIDNGIFTSNTAMLLGAVNANYETATLTINDGTFTNNKVTSMGGGVNYNDNKATLTITNGNFTSNTAKNGGVTYNLGTLIINNGTFASNNATNTGGVTYNFNNAILTINDGTFVSNTATTNGGVTYNSNAKLTITNGNFTSNTAKKSGGVNYNYNKGEIIINNGTYANNKATENGGVNYNTNNAILTITNGNFTNNTAVTGSVHYNTGSTTTINNGTFADNKGSNVLFNNGKSFKVINSTFIDNQCNGKIFNEAVTSNTQITNNTYIGNSLASTMTITPSTADIKTKTELSITIKPNQIYNTTISTGNITISENDKVVETIPVTNGAIPITYTPSSGKYNLKITYTDQTNSYNSASKEMTVDVQSVTKLNVTLLNNTYGSTSINVSVIDTDTNKLIPNSNIIVTLPDGTNITKTTDETDKVNINLDLPLGKNNITITYKGNDAYKESTESLDIDVTKIPSVITMDDITTKINDTNIITIKVNEGSNNPVPSGKVILKLNGKTLRDENGEIVYGTLNEDGVATVTKSFNLKVGTYTITAVYGGDSYYTSARKDDTTLTVTPREAEITINDLTPTVVVGGDVSFTVKLTDGNALVNEGRVIVKLNGKTVRDSNGNVVYTNVVNGEANVQFTIPTTFKAKTYNLTVVYASSSYARMEESTSLEVTNLKTVNTSLKTIDTSIITDAHTVKSNDSTTESIVTIFDDNTPKALKI